MAEMKDRLKELRKVLNLKQRELAERIGVRTGEIGNWESGRSIPDSRLRLICKEFNVRRDWLENGEGEIFEANPSSRKISDYTNTEIFREALKRLYDLLPEAAKNEFHSFCNRLRD